VVGGVVGGVEGGTGDEPILPTGDMVLPVIQKKVEPNYPDIARRARIEGKVILQAVVNKEGDVNEVNVLSSTNPMFNDAAIEAVKQWKYKPALQNGKPVSVYYTIRVDFRLR
jgi:protein TonB